MPANSRRDLIRGFKG